MRLDPRDRAATLTGVLVAGDVEPTPRPRFTVLPRRWVVERTLAWIGRYRRLSKLHSLGIVSRQVIHHHDVAFA